MRAVGYAAEPPGALCRAQETSSEQLPRMALPPGESPPPLRTTPHTPGRWPWGQGCIPPASQTPVSLLRRLSQTGPPWPQVGLGGTRQSQPESGGWSSQTWAQRIPERGLQKGSPGQRPPTWPRCGSFGAGTAWEAAVALRRSGMRLASMLWPPGPPAAEESWEGGRVDVPL